MNQECGQDARAPGKSQSRQRLDSLAQRLHETLSGGVVIACGAKGVINLIVGKLRKHPTNPARVLNRNVAHRLFFVRLALAIARFEKRSELPGAFWRRAVVEFDDALIHADN